MSEQEFRRWIAYYRLEPWGDGREDLRIAVAAWRLAMFWVAPDDRPKLKLEAFMLDFDGGREKPEQSAEEQASVGRLIAGRYAGGENV